MSGRCDASFEASSDVRGVLTDSVSRAALDRATSGGGAALASALREARREAESARCAAFVYELGGGRQCVARVLALHVHRHAGSAAAVRPAARSPIRCTVLQWRRERCVVRRRARLH